MNKPKGHNNPIRHQPSDIQPQTILVTGGAGYIGSFTVKELLDEGFKVVVLDNLENGHTEAIDKRAVLEIGDIGKSNDLDRIFDKYKIDAIIDFAACLAVGESMEDPVKYLNNNVLNFITLLDATVKHNIKYVIKSSTASTYGNPEDKYFPLKEDYQDVCKKPSESALLAGKWNGQPLEKEAFFDKIISFYNEKIEQRSDLILSDAEIAKLRIPTSVYGLTKLLDEIILEKYNTSDVKSVVLRYFNVCGASEDGKMGDDKPKPTNLMTLVVYSALGKIPAVSIYGYDYPTKDGTGLRDYIHPIDLATGHVCALKYLLKNKKSQVFNLGTGKGYTVLEVIDSTKQASSKNINYTIEDRRSGDPAISIADPGKANSILGWKARYGLQDMAESAWKWHSNHPNGYEDK